MKINKIAIVGSLIFFTINILSFVVFYDKRHGGFNLFTYLVAQEFWPFEVGIVFKIAFFIIESIIIFFMLNAIKKIWVQILVIILLSLLSYPILDFTGL